MAEVLDFVSVDSNATIKSKSSELACEIDMMRSLKKAGIRTPDGDCGFWVIEQKAGNVDWQEVNSLVRPGVVRLFTYQLISRGACGVLYFFWRQPRIGSEKFYGGVLSHDGRRTIARIREIKQIGQEIETAGARAQGHEGRGGRLHPLQPRERLEPEVHAAAEPNCSITASTSSSSTTRCTTAISRWISRGPTEDLSKYKIVFAPSLSLLAGGEADLLKLYVQNGGTLVGTFNTGLVDEHHIAPDTGYPHDLTDLFGLEVLEFDPLPPGEENHLTFKGGFPATHLHPARMWCDIIEPKGCQVLATYAKDFYAGQPAMTMNKFGDGRAIYIGTMSTSLFTTTWSCGCASCAISSAPQSARHRRSEHAGEGRTEDLFPPQPSELAGAHHFYKPMHDFLTGKTFTGNYDLPPHGVLVLDEQREHSHAPPANENAAAPFIPPLGPPEASPRERVLAAWRGVDVTPNARKRAAREKRRATRWRV